MTISTVPELISTHSNDGCVAPGQHREVIALAASRTLVAAESGALVTLGVATGMTLTLPTPVVGMQFEVVTTVTRTSNSYKIITSAATVFMLGSVMIGDPTVAQSGDVFEADGTSIVAVTIDGDTKGGFIGSTLRFTALSATQWFVEGLLIGAGTLATPFAAS